MLKSSCSGGGLVSVLSAFAADAGVDRRDHSRPCSTVPHAQIRMPLWTNGRDAEVATYLASPGYWTQSVKAPSRRASTRALLISQVERCGRAFQRSEVAFAGWPVSAEKYASRNSPLLKIVSRDISVCDVWKEAAVEARTVSALIAEGLLRAPFNR